MSLFSWVTSLSSGHYSSFRPEEDREVKTQERKTWRNRVTNEKPDFPFPFHWSVRDSSPIFDWSCLSTFAWLPSRDHCLSSIFMRRSREEGKGEDISRMSSTNRWLEEYFFRVLVLRLPKVYSMLDERNLIVSNMKPSGGTN